MKESDSKRESPDESLADEVSWIRRAQDGEHQAFNEVVRAHQAKLRAFAARYVTSSDDVYDIVQDVFVDAFRHIDRFDINRDMGKWLRGICKYRVLKHFRQQKKHAIGITELAEALEQRLLHHDVSKRDNSLERLVTLRECIQKLKTSAKQLIANRYYMEMTVTDMAAERGTSAASVSVQLMRIRATLRICFTKSMRRQGLL